MKTNHFIILIISLALIGCAGGSYGDIEPNDTIEEANRVQPDRPWPATIYPEGDQDWYKVDVPGQGYLRVDAADVPGGLNLAVRFARYDEWASNKEDRLRSWHSLPDALPVHEPGTYYFVVRDRYNNNASEEPFQLRVDFLEEFDKFEPNNTVEDAKLVEFGEELTIAIYPLGDRDWFRVEAPGQGYINVQARDVPRGITPQVRFSTVDEWADPPVNVIRNWRRLPDACFIPEAGEYYLTFIDEFNTSASENPFQVRIDFIEEMDPFEPNDHFSDAKEISRGDTLSVAIFPTGDRDFFKINSGSETQLEFQARMVPRGIDPQMRLYTIDPDNPENLISHGSWQRLPVTFDVEPNQEYHVCLISAFNNASSPDLFYILVR